jgi:hypothetical protein
MKKILNRNLVLILVLVLLLGIFFYWFQIRPSEIRKSCDQIAWNDGKSRDADTKFYDWKYNQCLHSQGLK